MSLAPELRPLPATQILDRGIRLYREHFVRIMMISVIALFPFVLLAWLNLSPTINVWISFAETGLVSSFLSGVFACVGIRIYQQGAFEYREVLQSGWKSFWRIISAGFLQGLILIIPLLLIGLLALLMIFIARIDQNITFVVIGLIMLPVALFFSAKYAVTTPAIISEQIGASTAMSRSWALTNNLVKHVLGIILLTSLLTVLISVIPTLISSYLLRMITLPIRNGEPAISSTLTTIGLMITLPLRMLIIVALYMDLRIRQEGYDLEQALQKQATEPSQEEPIPTV